MDARLGFWTRGGAVVLAVAVAAAAGSAGAVDYYWTANGSALGGSGTWNTSSSNWFAGSSSGPLGAYVSGSTSQAFLQGISGTLTTSGTPQFTRINVTSGSFTLSGAVSWANNGTLSPIRAIVVSPSTSLTITSTNGAGLGLTVQGGGSVTFTPANKPYPGPITVATPGTRLIFTGINGLDGTSNSDTSTVLNLGMGTTVQIDRTNNYRQNLQLNGGTVDVRSGGAAGASLVFQNSSAITAGGTAKSTILSTTGTGQINLNSARTFTVSTTGDASGVDLEIAAQIIGSSGFTKSGSGTLLLTGSNTFSGTTSVSAGRLVLGNQYALAGTTFNTQSGTAVTGTLTFGGLSEVTIGGLVGERAVVLTSTSGAGVTLNVGTSGTTSLTVPLSGAGALRKVASGLVTLTATNTFQGPTTVSAGTLVFGSPRTIQGGSSSAWSAASLVTGSGATAAFAVGGAGFATADVSAAIAAIDRIVNGNGLLAGARIGFDTSAVDRFALADAVQDTTGPGGGAVGLVKLGSGTLVLSGSNAYSGGTLVNAGMIRFATGASLPATATVDIRPGAGLLADGALVGAGAWLASGRIAPASAGTLVLAADDSSGVSLAAYPSLVIGAAGSATLSGAITSGSTGYRFGGGDGVLTVSSTLTGGLPLTVTGPGTVALVATNTVGAVTLAGGTLQAAAGALGGSGTFSFGGGTLRYGAGNTTDYSPRFSTAANQAVSIDTNGQNVTFGMGLASAGGTLTKMGAGILSLAAPGTFTGETRVVAGTLAVQDREALQASTVNLSAGDAGTLAFTGTTGDFVVGGLRGVRNLDAGAATLRIGRNGTSTTYSGTLAAAALVKLGSGTLAIANTAAVGSLGVTQGTLTIDYGGALTTDNVVVPTAAVRLGGGTLRVVSGTAIANTQSFAGTTVAAGASSLVAATGSAGTITVNLRSLSREPAGVLTMTIPSSAQVTTTAANANGIIGPWLTVGGTTWASSGGDGVTPGGVSGLAPLDYGLLNIFGGSDMANTETSTSETLLAPLTTNSLRVLANAAGQTLDLGGSRLTLTSGGLISAASGTAAAVTITGAAGSGSLTAGDGTAAAELIVHQANAGGLTIAAAVVDNGSASVGVTKAGSGRLTLSGGNTFSGPVAIVGGRLGVTTSDAVATAGGITVYEGSGNQFSLDAAGVNVAQPLTLRGGGAVGVGALQGAVSSGTVTYSGPITVSGSTQAGGHFASNAGGALDLVGPITHAATAAVDRFVTVRDGTVILSGSGSSYAELRLSSGTVRLGVANAIPSTASMRVGDTANAGTTATLDLNGCAQTLAAVTNELSGANSASRITSISAPATLTLVTASGTTNAYSGSLTGSLALVKQGNGRLRLTGTSDLAGDVVVQSGTLELARSQPQFGTLTGTTGTVRAAGGTIVVAADNALHGYGDGNRPYVIGVGGLLTTADGVTTHATTVALVGGTLASGLPNATFGSYAFSGTDGRLTAGGAAAGVISAEDVRFGTPGFAVDVADGVAVDDLVVTGWFGGTNGFQKTGAGRMVLLGRSTLTGSTTVQGGVLQLANGSALASSRLVVVAGGTGQVAPVTTTSVASLDLASGNGLLDLTSGALTIAGGMTAPQLVAEILEGRADGSWSGTSGITSSVAATAVASSIPRAVGWIDNGDGSLTAAYAAPGDTNIDWSIDILDASNFLALGKFDTGLPATWIEGDFSYDGIVDILDAADFFATGLYDGGNYNTAPGLGGVAAVPEPASVSMIAVMVAATAVARRRRRFVRAD